MRLIVLWLLLLPNSLYSQLRILNSGFEGPINKDGSVPPTNFISCSETPDTQPIDSVFWPYFLAQYQGISYLGVQANLAWWGREEASVALTCPLTGAAEYQFSIHAYCVLDSLIPFLGGGRLQIYGCFNNCDTGELLWESPELTGDWQQYEGLFIADTSYSHLLFTAINDSDQCYVGVDAMSELTAVNYNYAAASVVDTVDECFIISGFSDDSTALIQWTSIPEGFSSSFPIDTICPNQTTSYICTATLPCGLQWSDTVTIVVQPNEVPPSPIIPNFFASGDSLPNWILYNIPEGSDVTLYDVLGRELYRTVWYANDVDLHSLSAATYVYRIVSPTGTLYRGKLVMLR